MTSNQQQQPQPAEAAKVKFVFGAKDDVKKDGVLKEQVATEKRTELIWEKKWKCCMKDFHKICLEEANNEGLSEEEFLKFRFNKNASKPSDFHLWQIKSSTSIPETSTGMIGWRSSHLDCSIERLGPLYISPRHTITPPEQPSTPPQRYIILG